MSVTIISAGVVISIGENANTFFERFKTEFPNGGNFTYQTKVDRSGMISLHTFKTGIHDEQNGTFYTKEKKASEEVDGKHEAIGEALLTKKYFILA